MKQYFSGLQQWLSFNVVLPHSKLGPLWPVPLEVVCHGVPAVSKTRITRILGKTTLENHLEIHHFEVSNNLPTVLFIFQGILIRS